MMSWEHSGDLLQQLAVQYGYLAVVAPRSSPSISLSEESGLVKPASSNGSLGRSGAG